MFDYPRLHAQWRLLRVVYQLFGQTTPHLRDRVAGERVFPLGPVRMYYIPSGVFAQARLSFVLATTGSLTLLLKVFHPVTLWRLLQKVVAQVSRCLRKLQVPCLPYTVSSMEMRTGLDLLTLNVEHTVRTKGPSS